MTLTRIYEQLSQYNRFARLTGTLYGAKAYFRLGTTGPESDHINWACDWQEIFNLEYLKDDICMYLPENAALALLSDRNLDPANTNSVLFFDEYGRTNYVYIKFDIMPLTGRKEN